MFVGTEGVILIGGVLLFGPKRRDAADAVVEQIQVAVHVLLGNKMEVRSWAFVPALYADVL